MYTLGKDLSMNAVKQYMIKFSNFIKLPEMYYHDDGYFLLLFHSFKDEDTILMRDPYTIHNLLMVLKE